MGQQGAHIADVILEDVRVPAANIIGGVPEQGFRTAMKTLDRGRLHVAAMCVGTAERLIEDSTRYAAEREQFGRPIGEFQLVQAMLADSRTEAYAARCKIGRASCRERVCQYVSISVVALSLKKTKKISQRNMSITVITKH